MTSFHLTWLGLVGNRCHEGFLFTERLISLIFTGVSLRNFIRQVENFWKYALKEQSFQAQNNDWQMVKIFFKKIIFCFQTQKIFQNLLNVYVDEWFPKSTGPYWFQYVCGRVDESTSWPTVRDSSHPEKMIFPFQSVLKHLLDSFMLYEFDCDKNRLWKAMGMLKGVRQNSPVLLTQLPTLFITWSW